MAVRHPVFRIDRIGSSWTLPLVSALLIGGLAPVCGREPHPGVAPETEVLLWAIQRRLPVGSRPDTVAAWVDGTPITLGEVALCVEAEPVRSPRECLDLLVDTLLVEAYASPDLDQDPRLQDARTSALASAALREIIDRPLADKRLSQQEVEQFLRDPANRPLFEAPELRECSHLLIASSRDDTAAAMELARRIASETDFTAIADVQDLHRLQSRYQEAAAEASLNLRVEEHLVFPPDIEEGSAPWPMRPRAVPEFARALFSLSNPGAVSEPIQTRHGVHFILLQRIYPAHAVELEEAQALARREFGQRRRSEALAALLAELEAGTEIIWYPENMAILWQDQEQIVRERSSAIIDSLQSE